MKLLQTLLFTLFFFSITFSQTTHIVISEFATRGTANATDEFVELYNPMDSVIDISGWKLEYKSASGTTWSLRATIPNNKTIPAFGFFLIAPTSYASSTTPDYRATEWSAGAADNGHFHITNVGGTEIDKVGYGTAIDPEGSPAPNHGTSANNNSVERKAKASSTADSLCSTGTHALIGNGQDTQQNNLDFVARTCNRNPQNTLSPTEPPGGTNLCDGSGIASVSPHSAQGNIPTNFVVKYFRNTQYTISDMRFVMPSSFSWSHSLDSVSITNATASVSIVADTILFEGITFSSDSSEITIRNVTPPDSTASFKIKVQTRCTTFREITTSPTVLVVGSPIPIASVKENDSLGIPIRNGQYVTLRGIVTVGNEFCSPSYMQDNTAGIGMFGTTTSAALTIGDDVIISGRVTHFNGFTQIDNLTLQQTLSQGNEVEPIVLTVSQVNEQNEGILAKILAVTVRDTFGNAISTWDCGTSGRNYRLYESPTAFTQIRADNCVNICGTTAPQDEIDLIGVVGQFDPSAPHNTGYQILPRRDTDVKGCGPTITSTPVESNLQQTSFTVSWTTRKNSSSFLKYGLTSDYELGVFGDANPTTNHVVNLTGLSPATIYYIEAFSDSSGDTCFAPNIIVSTTSPSASTGEMNAYFNQSVFTGLANPTPANGNANLIQKIINRINSAKRSVDATLYSLSGGNQGDLIASALVAAKIRGVKVRVVCEADNRNTNAFQLIEQNGIPIIDDSFGDNTGLGLMHNKFFVIDSRGGAPESIWVWTGSYNPTQPGTLDDFQNVIEIQDAALANAYTREFEEMWGSSTEVPNSLFSLFGSRKTNNTPHKFVINGLPVESYFSPSDRPASKLTKTINNTSHDFAFSTYSFTRNDVCDSIKGRKNAGKQVRGVMDNNGDAGYSCLTTAGVDVQLKTGASGLLHHKYAIVDPLKVGGTQYVWTGSMNWSNNGEQSNDENSLLVQNNTIANHYLQEFAARYYQFGGTDSLRLDSVWNSVADENEFPASPSLFQNYPNPFNPTTMLSFVIRHSSFVTLKVYDILGKEVTTIVNKELETGKYGFMFDANGLASGIYFSRLSLDNGKYSETKKMILTR